MCYKTISNLLELSLFHFFIVKEVKYTRFVLKNVDRLKIVPSSSSTSIYWIIKHYQDKLSR